MSDQAGARRYSSAYERNHEPVTRALQGLPLGDGVILEVGSGSGQHVCHFAQHVVDANGARRIWEPTEQADDLDSILAWREALDMNEWVKDPASIDLLSARWDEAVSGHYAMVMSMNVAHIVAWQGVVNLIQGASRLLEPGGVLYFYGPFRSSTRELEPSNASFDTWLKERFEHGGLRASEEVEEVAIACGFEFGQDLEMPSNNRSLWFRKIS